MTFDFIKHNFNFKLDTHIYTQYTKKYIHTNICPYREIEKPMYIPILSTKHIYTYTHTKLNLYIYTHRKVVRSSSSNNVERVESDQQPWIEIEPDQLVQ